MINENLDITSISQTDSGYPEYLDFTSLRTAAINFLGPVTSDYWTDYNVHDPGITTLEVLMYAILDLGYRANMPIANLLANPPGSTAADTNFFTPAQILGSNPASVTDYRKLFMDIGPVRNAWLIPSSQPAPAPPPPLPTPPPISGLYEIYLELESDLSDFATTKEWEAYQHTVRQTVRRRYNAHRNLCEDLDETAIHILKKKYIGISADLEIVPGTSVPAVYQAMVGALYQFFSPVPTFYTLPQLQAMGISPDTIFSGRPYTGLPSHGFILDTDLPDLPSGTPVNVSAVYQQILSVSGIATVRKLKLLDLDDATGAHSSIHSGAASNQWEFPVPHGWIPEFSIAGSSFRWFQNGQPLSINLKSYTNTLQINASHSGKVCYLPGAPNLDTAIPGGTYQKGLGDYYSIQNDFPQIYGIGPGGVPSTASDLRKAQAFQFKAFLLFFDQLLADYLAQLNNLRTIFSLGAPASQPTASQSTAGQSTAGQSTANQSTANTYFAGSLSSVPGLANLLRFPPAANTDTPTSANTLAFPVSTDSWNQLIKAGNITSSQLSALTPYSFPSSNQRDIAVAELTLVLGNQPPAVQYLQTTDGLWIYYFVGIWNSFVLLSQNNFTNQADAAGEAASLPFIGGAQANYNLISLAGEGSYSFTLLQSSAAYYNYLQAILEDPQQYTQRRTAFLEHLMARFSESFTDYALLSAGFLSQQQIADNQVGLMENFLTNLPALSGDRFKAYNYEKQGWDTDNISGYEKRFKAFTGIVDGARHYLCNFEVHKYEDKFNIKMALADEDLFICASPLQIRETVPAARALFNSLADIKNYHAIWRDDRECYALEVGFYERFTARSVQSYPDERVAMVAAEILCRMWRTTPREEDSWIFSYQHRAELIGHRGVAVRKAVEAYPEEKTDYAAGKKALKKINDPSLWTFNTEFDAGIGKLSASRDRDKTDQFIDSDGFRVYVQKDVIGKPDRCRYELLDLDNTWQFRSSIDFATEDQARAAAYQLLHYLADSSNYQIRRMPYGGPYRVGIHVGGEGLAESEMEFAREDLARELIRSLSELLQKRLYILRVTPEPFRWKFNVYLGLPGNGPFIFRSLEEYPTRDDAHTAACAFYKAGPHWRLHQQKDDFFLAAGEHGKATPSCQLVSGADPELELPHLLKAKAEIDRLYSGDEAAFAPLIHLDDPSRQGTHVYRLVDKDHPRAFHPVHPATTREEAGHAREQLILKGRRGYTYPEFCLGGDNVYFRQTTGQYYFAIRCRNDYFHHHELVLFESITGYGAAADAQTAFQQEYLNILRHAEDHANYGEGKVIRLKAQTHKQEEEGEKKGWVLVPRETQDIFEYAALDPVTELVKAARSYPVKLIREREPEPRWNPNDPCKDNPEPAPDDKDCDHGTRVDKYRFALAGEDRPDWVSARIFTTPTETYAAFSFFLLLLNYPGNYYIEYDWAECSYRVGIREVLAESTSTFPDEAAAWGSRGVERFICISQSKGGFHLDMRRDCTYSFFAACPNYRAIHPCTYETAAQRDEALRKLFQAAGRYPVKAWIELFPAQNYFEVRNVYGKPVARIPLPVDDDAKHRLNRVLDMEDAVWAGNRWEEDAAGPFLKAGREPFAIRPASQLSLKEWQKELLEFAAYFPIVRNTTLQGGKTTASFLLEIKFPGFVDLSGVERAPGDCGCPPADQADNPYCYLAWRSDQVFTNVTDAWDVYEFVLILLADRESYQAVHGHEIGKYGIQLHDHKDIVARNPQPYPYPAMSVDRLSRARACINAEGLDLVEHLLLRPGRLTRLGGGTEKEIAIPVSGEPSECSSLWATTATLSRTALPPSVPPSSSSVSSSTASATEPSFPFSPGTDPYSFIMTVVLPAWPARFRTVENRLLLESILQQECPAHVLLRILWLVPWDMCRFEYLYRGWLDSVAREAHGQKSCSAFSPERFIDFLFTDLHPVLEDCRECAERPDSHPHSSTDEWLKQVNLLYGWNVPKQELEAREPARTGPEPTFEAREPEIIFLTNERDRRRLFTARVARYQEQVEEWAILSHQEELAGKTAAFLKDPNPSAKRFEGLLTELIGAGRTAPPHGKAHPGRGDQPPGTGSHPSGPGLHRLSLAGIALSFYLDKVILDPGDGAKWEHLTTTWQALEIVVDRPEQYYQEWQPEEMRQLVRNLDSTSIRALLRGEHPTTHKRSK
jgi:hypothetical protein